jgi:NlpC/P60 family putative phage cell wall peptidase
MPSSLEIIAEARRWIGTPYHHQAAKRGVGCDCIGLIVGVGKTFGLMGEDFDERFKQFAGYSRVPNPRMMRRWMELFLEPADVARNKIPPPGFIAWIQWREELPMHLGIIADFEDRATMIHSYKPVGYCAEHTFDANWRERVHSFWKFKGLD